jgi:hypothetical protein
MTMRMKKMKARVITKMKEDED